jgi:hypothetical protein
MAKVSSWIEEIGYYNQQKDDKRRLIIYGPTGAGKTQFASTAPKPFFIDSDKGGLTLRNLEVPFVPIKFGEKAYEKVQAILTALVEGKEPFDKIEVETVVFDSFTSLADMLIYESMLFPARGGIRRDPVEQKPQWDDYNAVKSRLHDIVLRCKDLGLNIIAICGEKLEKDDVLGTFIGKPNLVGSYRDTIGYNFDEVYYLHAEGQKDKRKYYLETQKYRYYEAKSRWGLAERYENATFDKLYKGGS